MFENDAQDALPNDSAPKNANFADDNSPKFENPENFQNSEIGKSENSGTESSDNSQNNKNAEFSENVASEIDENAQESEIADESDDEPGSATLEEALEKFNIQLPAKKVRLLRDYCELLWTWNERINLTRHTTFDKFVARDLVDSMKLAELLQKGEHVLDVGSGGGVPGLVVAILRPDVVVELCDSTGKKAEALGAIVDALGLELNVWYAKAEELLKVHRFHSLTIRAVGKIHKLLTTFAPLWFAFDRILTIKGPNWIAERGEARHYNLLNNVALRKLVEYENPANPGDEHNSVVLQFCRKNRLEELDNRAKDREEGKPIEREVESVEVDNKKRDGEFERSDRGGSNRDERSKRGAYPRKPGRRFVDAQNRRNSQPNAPQNANVKDANASNSTPNATDADGKVRVFARRNGKPPKGWTGKNREFRTSDDATNGGGERRNLGRPRRDENRSDSGSCGFRSGDSSSGARRSDGRSNSGGRGKFGGRPGSNGRGGFGGRSGGRGGRPGGPSSNGRGRDSE